MKLPSPESVILPSTFLPPDVVKVVSPLNVVEWSYEAILVAVMVPVPDKVMLSSIACLLGISNSAHDIAIPRLLDAGPPEPLMVNKSLKSV